MICLKCVIKFYLFYPILFVKTQHTVVVFNLWPTTIAHPQALLNPSLFTTRLPQDRFTLINRISLTNSIVMVVHFFWENYRSSSRNPIRYLMGFFSYGHSPRLIKDRAL